MALGGMGSGFVTVAAVQRWQIPDSTAGIFTAALLVGQTVGNLAFGFLSDRFGHKLSLEVGIGASLLGFGVAWLAPAAEWYYAAFVLLGIGSAAVIVSGILVVMEFCEPARRPTYVGITNTGVGLAAVIAPMFGAGLAKVSYSWVFATSVVINLIALVAMQRGVRDPRETAAKE
jgi:DHA1 family bicyclomycin/chloramphenicol resistance-like MFS transporter